MITALKPIEMQSNFILNVPGRNLEEKNIAFSVKKIIHLFLDKFGFLIEDEKHKVGRPKTYETDELLGLILLGAINDKNSCRKLEQWIKNNDETCNYILNNKKPHKSTINKFYNQNGLIIELLFDYTIELGEKAGLIGFKLVTIDGTIFKANASKNKLIRIEELNYLENIIGNFYKIENGENILFKIQKYFLGNLLDESNEKIIKEIKNNLKKEGIKFLTKLIWNIDEINSVIEAIAILKKNYDGKHTISVTDPECRWMPDKKGVMGLNYNYQVASDDKYDFMVGQKLVNDATDHNQLIPMIETVKMNLSRHPDFYAADNGFLTTQAVEYLFKHNIKAIMPDRDESSKIKGIDESKKFKKSNFEYNWVNDTYICPEKKILEYQNNRKMSNGLNRIYSTDECKSCNVLEKCTKGSKREISHLAHPLRIKMREDYHSDFGREQYKKRFHTGESYFGTFKHGRNFQGIRRISIKKAQTELTIQAIVHNIKILHKHKDKW